jgi:RNA polymerase sigma-70 factor (ECF subfamily)
MIDGWLSMGDVNTNEFFLRQSALGYTSALYGYAMILTRDQTTAEDLVQETYLRAVRAFDRLATESNLKSWLFTIMRNTWFNELRHARAGPRFIELNIEDESSIEFPDYGDNNPHVIFMREITRDEVRSAIESLPLKYREVVVLRDLEDFSYQKIAAVLGCPIGTVMSRLARAREKLRSLLDRWHGDTKAKKA